MSVNGTKGWMIVLTRNWVSEREWGVFSLFSSDNALSQIEQ